MAAPPTQDSDDKHATSAGIPPLVWPVFAILYLITVPWYLPRDWIDPTFWAFPAWAAVMISGAAGIAAFNAYVFLKLWPDDDEDTDSQTPPGAQDGP